MHMDTVKLGRMMGVGAVVAGAVWCGGSMSGCTFRRPVEVSAGLTSEDWSPQTAVDVRNFHGSVTVVVDPTLERGEPTAVAHAAPPVSAMADSKATESVTVTADLVKQEGGRVLKVRTGTTWKDERDVWVDVTVRVPSCAGATVWNRGGPVEIVGVCGAVQVDNGPLAGSGGRIELRTAQAMTEPVTLVTSEGSITYQVGPNSTGMFTLESGSGRTEFLSYAARPENMMTDGRSTTAYLNGGRNPIVLRSDKGSVRAMVMEEPQAYRDKTR
jgi:hypothetical protein